MFDVRAFDRLREAVGDDPADLVDIATSFLDEAPSLLASMAQAAETGDHDTVHRQAHSLKSNARDFGATRLAELCQVLEQELKSGGRPDDLVSRVAAVSNAWDEVRPLIVAEVDRIGSGA